MKIRSLMSRQLRALGPLACGLTIIVMAASPIRAAPTSDAPQSPSAQMVFVDLTAQGSATPKSAVPDRSTPAPAAPGTMFIDLTTGAAPIAMPDRVLQNKT